jgi:helicase
MALQMEITHIKSKLPEKLFDILKDDIKTLRPAQEKAVKAGLLDGKSLLICTPTASGKTLIAELAAAKSIMERKGKAVYIVPLKALATEKFKDFRKRYGKHFRVALSIGNLDSKDAYLADFDLIIATSEKLDSLIRHHTPWLRDVSVLVVDEVHLLNDPGRGPTLEVLITLQKQLLKNVQIIALSATVGNPKQLADWLGAELVIDDWRPVELKKGIILNNEIEFY